MDVHSKELVRKRPGPARALHRRQSSGRAALFGFGARSHRSRAQMSKIAVESLPPRTGRRRLQPSERGLDGREIMTWTTTTEGAFADLGPENEERLMLLLTDAHLASFVARAFNRLTRAQQANLAATARDALGVVPSRLKEPFLRFAEQIG